MLPRAGLTRVVHRLTQSIHLPGTQQDPNEVDVVQAQPVKKRWCVGRHPIAPMGDWSMFRTPWARAVPRHACGLRFSRDPFSHTPVCPVVFALRSSHMVFGDPLSFPTFKVPSGKRAFELLLSSWTSRPVAKSELLSSASLRSVSTLAIQKRSRAAPGLHFNTFHRAAARSFAPFASFASSPRFRWPSRAGVASRGREKGRRACCGGWVRTSPWMKHDEAQNVWKKRGF